jgi:hypothetical protein
VPFLPEFFPILHLFYPLLPFSLFLSPFFLFLHFHPYYLPFFILPPPQMTSADIPPPQRGGDIFKYTVQTPEKNVGTFFDYLSCSHFHFH